MANVFFVPKYIVSGEEAVKDSMGYIKGFGECAMIVTDEMMVRLGNVKRLTEQLDNAGIRYIVYPGVNTEPDDQMVRAGEKLYLKHGCDFLIGLGGGSPMDTAKAIGIVISNGGDICEYADRKIVKELPPVIAVPTTAGTGSEATRVAVIKDTDKDIKMMISDVKLLAALAVVDPVFTMTAPPQVTANTGIDALSHAIESYTSVKAFPMSKMYSMTAVKNIFNNLPAVYKDGSNIKARKAMSEASMAAGIAFSNASVSIVHGMSRPVGALFHVPHGLSNAMLLRVCLPYIKDGAAAELHELARELELYNGSDIYEGADSFVRAVENMLDELNIQTLSELGIDRKTYFSSIPKMAADALASGSPQNCRNIPSEDEIYELYRQLWG